MKLNVLIISIFLICSYNVKSQESTGGLPYTFKINTTVTNLSSYRTISPQINNNTINPATNSELIQQTDSIKASCSECHLNLYGKEYITQVDFITNATFEVIDSMKIWRYEVSSASALGLQIYFSKFNIPFDGEFFVYDEEKKFLLGAFTSLNNDSIEDSNLIKFGTAPIPSDKVILEYNQPLSNSEVPQISIYSVVHVFKELTLLNNSSETQNRTSSTTCETNISCPEGFGWDDERKSTVLILAYSNTLGYYGTATGALINTSTNSGAPYLLTAGHVIKLSDNTIDPSHTPSSLMFLFNYETSTCNSLQGTTTMNTLYSVYGSTALSSKYDVSDFDYALLQLNTSKETLSNWGVCYAGWNKTAILNALQKPSTMIHHPYGNEKSISVSINSDLESIQYVTDASTDNTKGFYRTKWATGSQEIGSSGAPIFDYYHKIIGILNGGPGDCVNEVYNNDWARITKFSKSFTDGGFGFWLDPNNSNAQIVNAYCPTPIVSAGGGGSGTVDPNNQCKTVAFTVNGQDPTNKIINVCTSDIWLNPKSPNCSANDSRWFFKTRVTPWMPCAQIQDKWAATRTDEKYFMGQLVSCKSYFLQLFIAVQECDYNLNLVGPEYSKWYYIYDGDLTAQYEDDNFRMFNVNGYFAPQGLILDEGKYYKIKVATYQDNSYPGTWHEYSAYVKTFATGTNIIQNQTITRNEFGTNIKIINSTVPASSAPIKVVAENSIKIQNETKLQTGRYYLQDLDCNNIKLLRTSSPDSTNTSDIFSKKASANNNNYKKIEIKSNESLINSNSISTHPVPSNNNCTVVLNLMDASKILSCLYDVNGKKICDVISSTLFEKGTHKINLNTSDLINGVYILKSYMNSKLFINKLIVSHE